jgi:octaprenyl-diphosphate synthase
MASSLDDVFACRVISESARKMCEGELRQVASRGDFDLSESDYFEIIAGKTAALTACCCRLGAHYAGATPEVCERLARYGHDLGLAFQIADDLLDLSGDEAVVGKSLGTDLVKQKATLPLIHLLGSVSPQDRVELLSVLNGSGNHHRDALRPWFERHGAISYAREKAQWLTRRAGDQLATLPATAACDSLLGLTDFVISRHQ